MRKLPQFIHRCRPRRFIHRCRDVGSRLGSVLDFLLTGRLRVTELVALQVTVASVVTSDLVALDGDGRRRVVISGLTAEPGVTLLDARGVERAYLVETRTGPSLTLADSHGVHRAFIAVAEDVQTPESFISAMTSISLLNAEGDVDSGVFHYPDSIRFVINGEPIVAPAEGHQEVI